MSPGDEITNWPFRRESDFWGLMRQLKKLMEPQGRVWEDGEGRVRIATGGWSENEDFVSSLRENRVLWSLCWESSHRGGLVVLRPPLVKDFGGPKEHL